MVSNFVTIRVDPTPTTTLIGSSTACLGEVVTFGATGGFYEFYKNNIAIAPISGTNNVTTTVNNGDQIKVDDTNSCTAESSVISMTVTNAPASISSGYVDDTMCEGVYVFIRSLLWVYL